MYFNRGEIDLLNKGLQHNLQPNTNNKKQIIRPRNRHPKGLTGMPRKPKTNSETIHDSTRYKHPTHNQTETTTTP